MFNAITPEQAGISSKNVAEFIDRLNRRGINTHGVLIMKGNDIFAEYYWAPFNKDFCHRMYSQTKSYVGIAIGLLIEEGKLSLDDIVYKFFPDRITKVVPDYLKNQTVKDMLTMCTTGEPPWWFPRTEPDRTQLYFDEGACTHPSGTIWAYDSPGSQVLSSLVEKLSGKPLLDYLKEKLFNKMGTFKTASILKTRNNDSWGDSALICTMRDMASFARFVMNYGTWNGERLMNEQYLREATSKVVCNNETGFNDALSYGYGYQIWKTEQDGFAFIGMGGQLTICAPHKDVLFTITSDNQGYSAAYDIIINAFYDYIVDTIADTPLPEDKNAQAYLTEKTADLKIRVVEGEIQNSFANEISGKKYICDANPMGISEFTLTFNGNDEGVFKYKNAQGEKEIPFGMGKNVFSKFPQLGYSGDHGGATTDDGSMYDCAASAAWREDKKLLLRVQIIDRYFGNFIARIAFKDDMAVIRMKKTAEFFLGEYNGSLVAHKA